MTQGLSSFLETVGPEAAFETLCALLPDAAVFVVDADRNVAHWSDGAERLLGFSRRDVLGRICLSGIRCRNCMIGCGIEEYGNVSGAPLELYRKDGRAIATRKFARAFFDSAGDFQGGIEVLLPSGGPFDPGPLERGLPDDAGVFHELVTRDPGMKRAFQTIRNVAETDATVLVRGESGTGKELVARAIHDESHRRDQPFVAVNCAALTPSLIESELFGHKKGAFTGAANHRIGLFEQAHRGTLLLDEVAELPLEVQSKLLRVLEERVVTPVGSNEERTVDVRIVAATHRGLRHEVEEGRFREDLMYRLRVVPLFLPPLRERIGDVELLMRRFLEEFNQRGPRHVSSLAPEAMRALLDHSWPGNVRELRNVVEYAFAVGRGTQLELSELPPEFSEAGDRSGGDAGPKARSDGRPENEADRIRWALEQAAGHLGKAADLLGMSRATFWRKRKKHGLGDGKEAGSLAAPAGRKRVSKSESNA